jgi:hypothetical protein
VPKRDTRPRDLVLSYAVDQSGRFIDSDPLTLGFALGAGFRVRKALHSPLPGGGAPLVCVTLLLSPPCTIRVIEAGQGSQVTIPVR